MDALNNKFIQQRQEASSVLCRSCRAVPPMPGSYYCPTCYESSLSSMVTVRVPVGLSHLLDDDKRRQGIPKTEIVRRAVAEHYAKPVVHGKSAVLDSEGVRSWDSVKVRFGPEIMKLILRDEYNLGMSRTEIVYRVLREKFYGDVFMK